MALRRSALILRVAGLKPRNRTIFSTTKPEVSQDGRKLAEFPGVKAPYANKLEFLNENSYDPIPIYRVLSDDGNVIDKNEEPNIDNEDLIKMHKTMIQLNQMDKILYESQRQGRISFYMTSYGEEGVHVGSAAALTAADMLFAQYRETGVLLYRGVTVAEMVDQCYGNCDDPASGRMMPVHYGSKRHNIATISSPLATQMPQAVGAAYALKLRAGGGAVAACYFGEGAASEGDAHAALNFAATLECPVIFLCRNNGYAISTPSGEQYRGDGVAARGPALGVRTARVDGTDPLAVFRAVSEARAHALAHSRPVLIEAMCYRVGHHSTSDDSTAYRPLEEIQKWAKEHNPVTKFKAYLEQKGLWSDEQESAWAAEARALVLSSMQAAERKPKPHWREMFEDVYHDMPPRLQKQMKELEEHLKTNGEHYPLDQFKKD